MHAPISAHAAGHGFVLFDAGFAQFQPQVQQFRYNTIRLRCLFLHDLPGEAVHGHILALDLIVDTIRSVSILHPLLKIV